MMRVFPSGGGMPRSFRGGVVGILVPVILLGVLFAAVVRQGGEEAPTARPGAATIFVPSFERLPPVPSGHYELWSEHADGGGERLAAFTVSVGGALLDLAGEPVQEFPVSELPPSGSTIVLTVEAGADVAETRSGRVLLRGTLSTTDVMLVPALPSLEGRHAAILLAPTDPAAPDITGVWFAKSAKAKGRSGPGLALAPLRGGWAYGGLVETAAGTMLPTGLFADPIARDASAPFSGKGNGLPVPGEDFVRNPPEGVRFPLNLADGRTKVTVSLFPDFAVDATEPFLPLLATRIPYQQKTGEPFLLEAVSADAFPQGKGMFERRNP